MSDNANSLSPMAWNIRQGVRRVPPEDVPLSWRYIRSPQDWEWLYGRWAIAGARSGKWGSFYFVLPVN